MWNGYKMFGLVIAVIIALCASMIAVAIWLPV
jgi:hypothetical protein